MIYIIIFFVFAGYLLIAQLSKIIVETLSEFISQEFRDSYEQDRIMRCKNADYYKI